MLDFAIQHRETLTTIAACAGMIGIALMAVAWVFRRRLGQAVVRVAATGLALTQILPATSDYRFRLNDIAYALERVRSAPTADNPYSARQVIEANAALGDFSLFGLIFGLSFLLAAAIAIRPELLRGTGPREAAA
ncbi:MAG: hypothetical protein Q7T61_10620 [Caulobacter sp.]|nr:hypothetical protein [Caulobacter sp.]